MLITISFFFTLLCAVLAYISNAIGYDKATGFFLVFFVWGVCLTLGGGLYAVWQWLVS